MQAYSRIEWCNIRVPVEIHRQLSQLKEQLEAGRDLGHKVVETYNDRHGVPLYEVLRVLLERNAAHLERARRTGHARKPTRPARLVDVIDAPQVDQE